MKKLVALVLFVSIAGTEINVSANETDAAQKANVEKKEETATAPTELWTTDVNAAQARATDENKAILLAFTGSDWCKWCGKLSDEIFSQAKYQTWAKDKVVMVELDFPKDVSKQSPELQTQNTEWLKKLGISGIPAVVLLDPQGIPFARTGYKPGGVDAYVKHLNQLAQIRLLRDTAMDLAADAEGELKARLLDSALSTMEAQLVGRHYGQQIAQIQKLGSEKLKAKYAKVLELALTGTEKANMKREEWMTDPFGFLAADMEQASNYLGQVETKRPVDEFHPRLEQRLVKLIELMSKSANQNASGNKEGKKVKKAAAQSKRRQRSGKIGDLRNPGLSEREWAKLTPKQREKILQSKTEGFPADFDDVLSDYFRQISREEAEKSESQ